MDGLWISMVRPLATLLVILWHLWMIWDCPWQHLTTLKLVKFSAHGYPFHNTVYQTVKHITSPTGPGLVSTSPLSSSNRTTTSPTALLPILEAKLGHRQGEAQHMHTPTTGVWLGGT